MARLVECRHCSQLTEQGPICGPCARARGRARGGAHRARRATLLARPDPTCWLCGQPVDVTLPAGDRWAPEADHVTPLAVAHGDERIPADTVVRLAHRQCNITRGAG